MGWEFYGGFDYQWNENTSFIWNIAVHLPGKYFDYRVVDTDSTGSTGSPGARWMWSLIAAVNF